MLLSSKKRTNHISVMVVPHYDAPVRTIRIPYALVYGLVVLIVLGGVMLWQMSYRYNAMSEEIALSEQTNSTRTIALLQDSFHRMSNELEREQRTVSSISECLCEIERLDDEIMLAAGFDASSSDWDASLLANGLAPSKSLQAASVSPDVSDNIDRLSNSMVSEKNQRERSLAILRANYEEAHRQMDATPSGFPCAGYLQDGFGYFPWRGRFHFGIDIIAPRGTPIYASADGKVVRVQYPFGGYGKVVDVLHDGGILTRYGHCSEFFCEVGDYVSKGQLIAAVGNTGRSSGSHLHYEIRIGASVNSNGFVHQGTAVDPMQFP